MRVVCPVRLHVWCNLKGVVSCVSYLEGILCCGVLSALSGIKKRPLLGDCLSVITMVISILNTECVRCREVVRFSEGPLSEVRLYSNSDSLFAVSISTFLSLHNFVPSNLSIA